MVEIVNSKETAEVYSISDFGGDKGSSAMEICQAWQEQGRFSGVGVGVGTDSNI